MKAAVTDGGSPTFERDDQQRKVPIGLDKSWESRRIEGIELMVSSIEQQKERQKKTSTCKSCPHGNHQYYNNNNNNNNNSSSCSGHHHHRHHHRHNGNVVAVDDNGFVLPKEKTRSLTGLKKNKMSITTSAPQKSLVFDSLTHIEGSSVGRRQKQAVHVDMAHNACLTPDSFKVRELEQQVLDLIHQLAQEKHQSRQDKISLSKLQQQVARNKSEKPVKEVLMKELEQEKRRRELLEQKLRDRNVDCCCQNEMVVLKKENTRLNEVVQDLLPYKNKVERLKQSNASSAALLEAELHRLRSKLESLDQDNSLTNMELRKLESVIKNCQGCTAQLVGQIRLDGTPRSETASTSASVLNDSDKTKVLLERLKNLEAEKSSLVLENEAQFRHYEKCLEDVTNQILDALLVQKTLKEECSHLKERVAHLEEENNSLKQSQSNSFHASAASMMNNHGASVVNEFRLQTMLFRPDPILNESCRSSGRPGSWEMPVETREDDDDDEVEDGCQSSLSLNEILDSAAGSTNGSTDAEDGNRQAREKQKSLVAKDEEERSKDELLETEARKKTTRNDFGGGPRYREEVCNPNVRPNNLNVFVDMSASDSFALLGNCSCSNGQFIHLGATSSAKSSADVNSNLVSEGESAPLDKQPGPPSKSSGHRKVFRGDSGWKKFLPVGCTSPQEERDEGYLSNKTSEGSSDVSNPFASRAS